jgi:signal transduction histidine kinase/ligand-binding sensor domain-containing protein
MLAMGILTMAAAWVNVLPVAASDIKSGQLTEGFRTRHWTTGDGLPSNTVDSLLQTHDGYIWVGTKRGLARFDGVRFKVFVDELRIEGNEDLRCYNLLEDIMGRLWVHLPAGLVCYDRGKFEKFSTTSGPLRGTIFIASRRGGLWVGTENEGLRRFERGQNTQAFTITNGLNSNRIGHLREDTRGRLWIGYPVGGELAGLWQRLDPQTGELKSLSTVLGMDVGSGHLEPDGDEALWFATADELLHWNEGKLERFSNAGLWRRGNPPGITLGEAGEAWLRPSSTGKILHFHDRRFDSLGMKEGLADSDFRSIMRGREGDLWIGMGAGGLQQLRHGGLNSLLTTNATGGRQQVESICAGKNGEVWLGTWNSLLRWQDGLVRGFTNSIAWEGIPWEAAFDLKARPVLVDGAGRVWFGARDRGLFTLEGDRVRAVPEADDGRTTWTVRVLHEDHTGTLWIGSDSGLSRWSGGRFVRFTTSDGLLDNEILGIRDAAYGSLWVGTKGGIQRLEEKLLRKNGARSSPGAANSLEAQGQPRPIELPKLTVPGDGHAPPCFREVFRARDGLLSDAARPLLVEDDGTLWVGTPKGLNRVRAGKISSVTERQGLRENDIFSFLDDGAGNYWACCDAGILRMRKAELHAVADGKMERLACVTYGEADGAISTECIGDYQPNACRAQDGRMWFPTTRGAVVLDPAKLIANRVPPPVVIQEVLADDQPVFEDDRSIPLKIEAPQSSTEIKFPAGRARVLELQYTANTFVAPSEVRFRYRLEGADSGWRDAGTRRSTFYTNLRPRAYRFYVKASTEEGVWSEQPATFAFSIAPHFYETWLFYIGTGVSVALAGFGLHHRRVRGLRQIEVLERQRALHEERGRIARDLHDDLGATLTGMALQLEAAQRRGQAEGDELGALAHEARSLTHEMRELAWTTNPRCDNVNSVVAFITEYCEHFCSAAGLALRLELPTIETACPFPARQRHELLVVLKESLANISKHASAKKVRVSLTTENRRMQLCVKDDGAGFETNSVAAGSGLRNMRERIEQLGGDFVLESRSGGGTTVTVILPMEGNKA